MNKKKTVLAAIVLLLIMIVGGVVAYFTDTETATNTFTIGNVDITLTEPAWKPNDAKDLMPGETVAKDPTITNVSTKNDAFVFAKVEVPCVGTKEVLTYTANTAWYLMENGTCTDGKATKVYAYGSSTAMTTLAKETAAPALFTQVTVANLTNAEQQSIGTSNLNMVITGYGIQADGLASTAPTAVWGNFNSGS